MSPAILPRGDQSVIEKIRSHIDDLELVKVRVSGIHQCVHFVSER